MKTENKEKLALTDYEKKYIAEEVKRTKEINNFLAKTKIKTATFKKKSTGGVRWKTSQKSSLT